MKAPSKTCANCKAILHGEFCSQCGQRDRPVRVSFWALMGQWLRETFEADGRLGRTILPLFWAPGRLIRAYLEGQRVHYTSPIRLYIFAALICFFTLEHTGDSEPVFRFGFGPPTATGDVSSAAETSEHPELEHRSIADDPEMQWMPDFLLKRMVVLESVGDKEASRRVGRALYDVAPTVVTLLLPFAALILELLYRRRYYVEHLVFTVELHAVLLLLLSVAAIVGTPWAFWGVFAVGFVHFIGALRRVYTQSWPRTIIKAGIASILYFIVFITGLVGAVLAAVVQA